MKRFSKRKKRTRKRRFSKIEIQRLKRLTDKGVPFTIIIPTKNALKKHVVDATAPVRVFFQSRRLHDYQTQKQGPENKRLIKSSLIKNDELVPSQASLYRPKTKKGDPRIWVKELNKYSNGFNLIALFIHNRQLFLLNVTRLDVAMLLDAPGRNPLKALVEELTPGIQETATELLEKLRLIAKGPVKADLVADTAIGRTLERLLGIQMNSSRTPDYKGIELKSSRAKTQGRSQLFTKVPDWKKSKFKSSRQVLLKFGRTVNGKRKLYCTVSLRKRNPNGLLLVFKPLEKTLVENSSKRNVGDFLTWPLSGLHAKLIEKHSATFWIHATSEKIGSDEYFNFLSVEYTKSPLPAHFDFLLDQGEITVDHLIKVDKVRGVVEGGPSFKVSKTGFKILFPNSLTYKLS